MFKCENLNRTFYFFLTNAVDSTCIVHVLSTQKYSNVLLQYIKIQYISGKQNMQIVNHRENIVLTFTSFTSTAANIHFHPSTFVQLHLHLHPRLLKQLMD